MGRRMRIPLQKINRALKKRFGGRVQAVVERGVLVPVSYTHLKNGFYESCASYLQGTGVAPEDVIRPLEKPLGTDGAIAVLRGNLAPGGAVVKLSLIHI